MPGPSDKTFTDLNEAAHGDREMFHYELNSAGKLIKRVKRDNTPTASSPDYVSDVFDTDFQSLVISVATSQVLATTSGGPIDNRKFLRIINEGTLPIFAGPNGVTSSGSTKGETILPGDSLIYNVGPNIEVYLITASETISALIQEGS